MTATSPPSRASVVRPALIATAAAVCLTVLFASQEVLRRGPVAAGGAWSHALASNALDWGMWLLLVPVVFVVGSRHRLDVDGRSGRHVLVWVALAIGCCVVHSTVTGVAMHQLGLAAPLFPSRALPPLSRFLLVWVPSTTGFNLIIFLMIGGVLHASLYYRDLRAREMGEADLRARLAHAELGALRMQLQPHFLFNALHTVSSLMTHDVPGARRVITALGDLLRSSIDHTALEEITLQDELAFLDRYLEIQRARFRQRLVFEREVPSDTMSALVPSLVLQPLVENAIRYGIEPFAEGGRVWISAERSDGRLVLAVANASAPSSNGQSAATASGGSGVGLSNLAARLQQLYGSQHDLFAGRLANGEFHVTITLPFHTAPS